MGGMKEYGLQYSLQISSTFDPTCTFVRTSRPGRMDLSFLKNFKLIVIALSPKICIDPVEWLNPLYITPVTQA
jgi:hypothetical protein